MRVVELNITQLVGGVALSGLLPGGVYRFNIELPLATEFKWFIYQSKLPVWRGPR